MIKSLKYVKTYENFVQYLRQNNYYVIERRFKSYTYKDIFKNKIRYKFEDILNNNPVVYEDCHPIPVLKRINYLGYNNERLDEVIHEEFLSYFRRPSRKRKENIFREEYLQIFLNSNHIIKRYNFENMYVMYITFAFVKNDI